MGKSEERITVGRHRCRGGGIILKLILKEYDMEVWTGFI
jgi:hypothetical protein